MKGNKGITLVALIVTIIVLLILAGVTLNTVFGDEGIITKANIAKITTEFSVVKEQFDLFSVDETSRTNGEFDQESLYASEYDLRYNTKKDEVEGTIFDIIQDLKESEFKDRFDIIKGELIITPANLKEKEIALSLGIKVSPYIIENGVLMSADNNLALVDSTGTVTIPSKATAIAEGTFADVEGIKTVIIPGTVKEIRKNAFSYNKTLEKVIIKEGVEIIGNSAFEACRALKSVECPESLLEIRTRGFYQCNNLENINIPSKITTIKAYCFEGAYKLKSIILPEGLQKIETYAFSACRGLESIIIPENLTMIEVNAFSGSMNLNNIKVKEENKVYKYESGMLMKKDGSEIVFISDKVLSSTEIFKIPNGLIRFEMGISNYTNIKQIEIPETLEYITESIPKSIENIKVHENNKNYEVKDKCLLSKDGKILYSCFSKGLDIQIPDGVEVIRGEAFKQATEVKNIIFSDSVTTIQNYAFSYMSKTLEKMEIGKNVKDISPLFKYNDYTGTVTIHKENQYFVIEDGVLYTKDKKALLCVTYEIDGPFTVIDTVESIRNYAFHNQKKMTEVIIQDSVKSIGHSFQFCDGLTTITIPSSVETIGGVCFDRALNLTKVIIQKPEGSIAGAPWGLTYGDRAIVWKSGE